MGFGDVICSPRQTDIQRFLYGFITGAMSTDIGHPMAVFIRADVIVAIPRPVDEGRESAPLVHIPAVVLVAE